MRACNNTQETQCANEKKPLIYNRADPYITYYGGVYYFTASVPEYDRIELRCAPSIEGLKTAQPRIVFTKHKSGIMSEHIWAPELHHIFGKWYIYFAAGQAESKWEIRPYVLECDDADPMRGEFRELGQMQPAAGDKYSFTDFSLDATVFEHGGRHYFVWAEKVGRQFGISNLYIAELESANKLKTVQRLLSTPDYDWERVDFWVNEGPAFIKSGGKIYLSYSASATGAMYCMGMLCINENDDLLDPRNWQKERVPVLKTCAKSGLYGPGHNCFVKDDKGYLCVFHAREYEKIVGDPLYDYNRHTFVMRMEFDLFGKPIFSFDNLVGFDGDK